MAATVNKQYCDFVYCGNKHIKNVLNVYQLAWGNLIAHIIVAYITMSMKYVS